MERISVVVCTYNRSAQLAHTLRGLGAQRDPGCAVEIIIVDNNSTDDTRVVVQAHEAAFGGRLRYLFEGRQGQSYARNTGFRSASGDVVAFTDDDAVPEPGWLAALAGAVRSYQADAVYGKILPVWQAQRPAWLGARLQNKLALLDHGPEPFVVASDERQFFGANFAVRKPVLEALGGFDVRLGRRGTDLGVGEDTALFERLLAGARRIVYAPGAVVHHAVSAERMTKAYFRRWHFDQGRSLARVIDRNGARTLWGTPWWVFRRLAGAVGTYARTLVRGDAEARVATFAQLYYYAGFMTQSARQRGTEIHGAG